MVLDSCPWRHDKNVFVEKFCTKKKLQHSTHRLNSEIFELKHIFIDPYAILLHNADGAFDVWNILVVQS